MFDYFNASTAKAFGVAMARYYIDQLSGKKKLDDKRTVALSLKVIGAIERKIQDFKTLNRLNFYKVANAANAFKWALKDAGYDQTQIDRLTEWFVIKMKS